ncbi:MULTISPECIES: hypothetical protein [Micromonospora]|uniref:Uncharacterized protein n=1 Tax=Micromonospora yangpuensis TaxID=683228 RepID=A0A1C6UM91_9ACTN|nr:hypothetical protein [Micromonospora yangpuensis]GGM27663.1 hypothetical protein GCM10012279_52820 [Micromonospora yangpuensis]SCL55137.1 hypothetical protein GA0070617_2872 [Micromonospora yangpuensis]
MLAAAATVVVTAVATVTVVAASTAPALAATTTLYAAPSGSGTDCTAAAPCSLTGAQTAVRARTGAMSGDIVVELADGVYRLTSPLRMTAADSGTNGYRVVWQAAASARPVLSGARATQVPVTQNTMDGAARSAIASAPCSPAYPSVVRSVRFSPWCWPCPPRPLRPVPPTTPV